MSSKKKKKDSLLSEYSTGEKATFAAGAGCVGVLVLLKLAFLALVAWGIYELVIWVTSK